MKLSEIFWGIVYLVFVVMLFCVVYLSLDIPIVYWSTANNECVKVLKDGVECDCSEIDLLNVHYEKVWVK